METLRSRLEEYDRLYTSGWLNGITTAHKLVLRSARQFRDRGITTILDVGCGRGILMRELGYLGYTVAGTEIAPSLLNGELKKKNVMNASIRKMPLAFPSEEFDLLVFADVLDHLPSERQAAEAIEIANSLAVKGVVATFNSRSPMALTIRDKSWWRRLVAENFDCVGLNDIVDQGTGRYLLEAWKDEGVISADCSCDE